MLTTLLMSKVILILDDGGQPIETDREYVKMSNLIQDMTEDEEDGEVHEIPVPGIKRETMMRVLEFCAKHSADPMKKIPKPLPTNKLEEYVSEWDAQFVSRDVDELFAIVRVSNFLRIPDLLDLGCAKIATMIKGRTKEEINAAFHIS